MSNLSSFKLLADENIQDDLVKEISALGFDILHTASVKLNGKTDTEIINYAYNQSRVILTHDSDFGRLIYTSEINFLGIIYLRPGHIQSSFHLDTFNQILQEELNLIEPFLLVAERLNNSIKIRLRNSLQ